MALERIVLNIIPDGEMPVFHCSQYENGRPVIIDLVSSDNDAFLVSEGVSVELHCRKVDDNIVTLEPDEVTNNTVTFVSTEQLTACPGDNLCEIVLYSDTDPVQTIASLNFILHVEPDPLEGGLTSETQIHNLTEQIEEITQQVIGDDYYDKTEVDGLLAGKADQATTYTKSEVDTALNLKADKATTYTKTQVDNALALKANTSDLATVATTGDYDDLIDKPDINAMIAAALLEVMPVGTVSGPIASFDTELAVPLVNVSCNIVATGGNGTPDNPNPINGYTEANIVNYNKRNIFTSLITTSNDGIVTSSSGNKISILNVSRTTNYNSGSLRSKVVTNLDSSKTYKYMFIPQVQGVTLCDGQLNILNSEFSGSIENAFLRITNEYDFVNSHPIGDNTIVTLIVVEMPAILDVHKIAFGQTVYGGVLDVTRGKLKPCIEYPSYNGETLSGRWLSSEATYVEGTTPPTGSQVVSLDDYGSDIDLTPEVILAIVGVNNVYSDTNGDTTVQYKDSIQHYIDQRV